MKPIVYIDGQNFLYKAAEVLIAAEKIAEKQDLHTFSFAHLFHTLLKNDDLTIRYYGTKLRKYKEPESLAQKSTIMLASQRQLRNSLAKQGVEFIESGKLKVRNGDLCKNCGQQDPHFQEKGVDVRLSVDMLRDAYHRKTDTFVLVSSDTDILPSVQAIREEVEGARIVYVGFSDKLTKALINNATETQIIRDGEIIEAFEAANPQPQLIEEAD